LYEENEEFLLLAAIVKVDFEGVYVKFADPIVFNVAWTPDIYYNRANHNLQSSYDGTQKPRGNIDFVKELKHQMEKAGHLKHY